MNLITILNSGTIKRLPLSQDVQDKLKLHYEDVQNRFLSIRKRVEFQGNYKCEDDEIYKLEGFDWRNKIKFNSLNDFDFNNILTIGTISINEIDNIKILIAMTEGYLIFQSMDNRKFIKPNSFLFYSKKTFNYEDKKGIKIDDNIDALLEIDSNNFLFNSFHNASKIFDLSDNYREATKEEIDNFSGHIIFQGKIDVNNLNHKLRKKIFLLTKNNILDKVIQNYEVVKDYAKQLGLECFNKDKINIPTDNKQLHKLINFLNEDLYKSPISGSIYESNSKKELSD